MKTVCAVTWCDDCASMFYRLNSPRKTKENIVYSKTSYVAFCEYPTVEVISEDEYCVSEAMEEKIIVRAGVMPLNGS